MAVAACLLATVAAMLLLSGQVSLAIFAVSALAFAFFQKNDSSFGDCSLSVVLHD